MNNRKQRIAVIGLGLFALGKIKTIQTSSKWKLCGAVDLSPTACARFQSEIPNNDIPIYRDILTLIKEIDFDVVLVATTAPSHVPIAVSLLQQGFKGAILIEKPISDNLSNAEELSELVAVKNRSNIAVDYGRRVSDVYCELKAVIQSNQLGQLLELNFHASGAVSMNGSHWIDLACFFTQSKVEYVTAILDDTPSMHHRGARFFDPTGSVSAQFENGAKLNLVVYPKASGAKNKTRLVFEHGEIIVSDKESVIRWNSKLPNKIGKNAHEKAEIPMADRSWMWFDRTLDALVNGESNGYAPCSIKDSLLSLEVISAAFLSHTNGGEAVPLPLSSDQKIKSLRIA